MKNLYKIDNELYIVNSSEQVNFNDYYITTNNTIAKADIGGSEVANKNKSPKIILTTNKLLIKDGVQAIDDEFLEWFVKNPSFEYLEVKKDNHLFCKHCNELHSTIGDGINCDVCRKESQPYLKTLRYKTIIPKEESKKETLEEAAERLYPTTINSFTDSGFDMSETERLIFINGAEWQAERMYSEEEALELLNNFNKHTLQLQKLKLGNSFNVEDWFEKNKKK